MIIYTGSDVADVGEAEHEERVRRVESVPCPDCGAVVGKACRSQRGWQHHGARWDAWYAANPEAAR